MKYEKIKIFWETNDNKNKRVIIGVDDFNIKGKLFFYNGFITQLYDEYLLLESEKGVKEVYYEDIRDIHLKGE